MNASGIMGATTMPSVAHVVSLAIEKLYSNSRPKLTSFGGSSRFGSRHYVDDISMIEPNVGMRLTEARQNMVDVLYRCMGPEAIDASKKIRLMCQIIQKNDVQPKVKSATE